MLHKLEISIDLMGHFTRIQNIPLPPYTMKLFSNTSVRKRLPLGVEDRRIPDSALSSSSRWDEYHGPHRCRLNSLRRGRNRGAWSSRANNRAQWLQIDVGSRAILYGMATQGRQDLGQWVKTYKVMYSSDGVRWRWYQVRRRTLVSFLGYSWICSTKQQQKQKPFISRQK